MYKVDVRNISIGQYAFSLNYTLLFFISDTFGERIYSETF